MTPKIPVLIKKGKLQFQEPGQDYLSAQRDGWYLCTITKPKSSRTNQMNRYLWGCVYKMIADETGYDSEQIHFLMKSKFGTVLETKMLTNEFSEPSYLRPPISTTKYTVEEMQDYWQRITQWAAEFLSLQIPEPNEMEI